MLVWYITLRLSNHPAKIELRRVLIGKVSITLLSTGGKFKGEMNPRLSDIKGTEEACESKSDRFK
jgi:hypothetical protein